MPHITPILGIIFTGFSLGGGAYVASKYLSSNKNKEVVNNYQQERNSRQVIKVNDGGENTPKEKDILWELYYKGNNESIDEVLGMELKNKDYKSNKFWEKNKGLEDLNGNGCDFVSENGEAKINCDLDLLEE
ncbi:hypothetical protein [Mycoplasma parvum]|uniref:Uncharacterized protein n=1 Tax=Mycoplasma parvum str. Indiana TaxID=1403316 RepID=U5NBJ2_9MOLU|nr:hypothetical protein [Mycoplasma parvum]AGX88916.1 hypothetical protein PRV_00750 [Mycoplasma parvum str. Indiana]